MLSDLLQQCPGLVREHLEREQSAALDRLAPFESMNKLQAARGRANKLFVADRISDVRAAARTVFSDPLTEEQAGAIATDEDATLVLAGAGTGKTAVIVGKAVHLVRNQDVSPRDILVLAFNRKAAEEIRSRLPRDCSAVEVSTFHGLGRRVIAEVDGRTPTISKLAEDDRALEAAIDHILRTLLQDSAQSKRVANFIAYHASPYHSPFEFESIGDYQEYVRSVELRTLSGDLVKSLEELVIANFLTEHGIEFRYEDPYEKLTATRRHRQYQPDFYLPEYDIYIEHFALDQQGRPPPSWEEYAEGVAWKRQLHLRYGTTLIETYSWQYREGALIPALRKRLEDAGVRFKHSSLAALVLRLASTIISWLARLLTAFLNHVKSNGLTSDELRARTFDQQREGAFLDVFEQVHIAYERLLEREQARDFHDLIHVAASYLREGRSKRQYRYVLVDEFQDISAGRMTLLQALATRGIAYFVVGDDWQSIYRFAGSDVALVRNCGAYLGHVQSRELTQTFRFGDGILGPSTAFVQRNPEQTKRKLRSASAVRDEGIIIVADSDPREALLRALDDIRESGPDGEHSVLVLGRYRSSGEILPKQVRSKSLKLEFSTVHGAKGMEADYVVVLDLTKRGFPSAKEDEPLLDLVLPPVSGKGYPFAEERRLFYVAMTRARIGVYLVTDSARPSTFVTELIRMPGELQMLGYFAPQCPHCSSGRLVPSQSGRNLRCSNYPDCKYLAPRCPSCSDGYAVIVSASPTCWCTNPACDDPPPACPSCRMGVLFEKEGRYGSFLGCTEYRSEPSCRYTQDTVPVR